MTDPSLILIFRGIEGESSLLLTFNFLRLIWIENQKQKFLIIILPD